MDALFDGNIKPVVVCRSAGKSGALLYRVSTLVSRCVHSVVWATGLSSLFRSICNCFIPSIIPGAAPTGRRKAERGESAGSEPNPTCAEVNPHSRGINFLGSPPCHQQRNYGAPPATTTTSRLKMFLLRSCEHEDCPLSLLLSLVTFLYELQEEQRAK